MQDEAVIAISTPANTSRRYLLYRSADLNGDLRWQLPQFVKQTKKCERIVSVCHHHLLGIGPLDPPCTTVLRSYIITLFSLAAVLGLELSVSNHRNPALLHTSGDDAYPRIVDALCAHGTRCNCHPF